MLMRASRSGSRTVARLFCSIGNRHQPRCIVALSPCRPNAGMRKGRGLAFMAIRKSGLPACKHLHPRCGMHMLIRCEEGGVRNGVLARTALTQSRFIEEGAMILRNPRSPQILSMLRDSAWTPVTFHRFLRGHDPICLDAAWKLAFELGHSSIRACSSQSTVWPYGVPSIRSSASRKDEGHRWRRLSGHRQRHACNRAVVPGKTIAAEGCEAI